MSGKGSAPRPIPDRAKYESEFDRIFGGSDGVRSVPTEKGKAGEAGKQGKKSRRQDTQAR